MLSRNVLLIMFQKQLISVVSLPNDEMKGRLLVEREETLELLNHLQVLI